MITDMDLGRFFHPRLADERIQRILSTALDAADPQLAVRNYLRAHPLPPVPHIYALAIGKASSHMIKGLTGLVPVSNTLVITKYSSPDLEQTYRVIEGGHPVPDESSLAAGAAALEFVQGLGQDDLLLCLISGGGSSLMSAPLIPLVDLQNLTSALLASGANIGEINMLRRHLDRVKGGGLARAANGAQIISLIISDVGGNALEAIASGPTAPDPTSIDDAQLIVQKYGLETKINPSALTAMRETLKPGDPIFSHVENHVIASNEVALHAAMNQASQEGFTVELITGALQGEARDIGKELAAAFRDAASRIDGPICLLAGGEATVTIRGNGKGGRNQELALAAMDGLAGMQDAILVSFATDGEDGPTDAAGAVVTGQSKKRAQELGLDVAAALRNNDSYPIFKALGDLILTGPTGTNVNDLVLLLRL